MTFDSSATIEILDQGLVHPLSFQRFLFHSQADPSTSVPVEIKASLVLQRQPCIFVNNASRKTLCPKQLNEGSSVGIPTVAFV